MPYLEGIQDLDANSSDLLVRLDQLRKLIESVYGQRITFNGESRPPSGTVMSAKIEMGKVAGDAPLRAREIGTGTIDREATADSVKPESSPEPR